MDPTMKQLQGDVHYILSPQGMAKNERFLAGEAGEASYTKRHQKTKGLKPSQLVDLLMMFNHVHHHPVHMQCIPKQNSKSLHIRSYISDYGFPPWNLVWLYKAIIKHPQVITICIGSMVTVPSHGWFMA